MREHAPGWPGRSCGCGSDAAAPSIFAATTTHFVRLFFIQARAPRSPPFPLFGPGIGGFPLQPELLTTTRRGMVPDSSCCNTGARLPADARRCHQLPPKATAWWLPSGCRFAASGSYGSPTGTRIARCSCTWTSDNLHRTGHRSVQAGCPLDLGREWNHKKNVRSISSTFSALVAFAALPRTPGLAAFFLIPFLFFLPRRRFWESRSTRDVFLNSAFLQAGSNCPAAADIQMKRRTPGASRIPWLFPAFLYLLRAEMTLV